MKGEHIWQANRSRSGNTEFISLLRGGKSLTFKALFELLQSDDGFADWYTQVLLASPFVAFFWEHPPLAVTTLDSAVEFVLVDAPMLAGTRPGPEPFRSHFAAGGIAVFRNLGGDAILIAPAPDGSAGYAHLAAFLRGAADGYVRSLWQTIASTVVAALGGEPIWLSTSGLGVAWPHVRLDSAPKYYQHGPYKRAPAGAGGRTS